MLPTRLITFIWSEKKKKEKKEKPEIVGTIHLLKKIIDTFIGINSHMNGLLLLLLLLLVHWKLDDLVYVEVRL